MAVVLALAFGNARKYQLNEISNHSWRLEMALTAAHRAVPGPYRRRFGFDNAEGVELHRCHLSYRRRFARAQRHLPFHKIELLDSFTTSLPRTAAPCTAQISGDAITGWLKALSGGSAQTGGWPWLRLRLRPDASGHRLLYRLRMGKRYSWPVGSAAAATRHQFHPPVIGPPPSSTRLPSRPRRNGAGSRSANRTRHESSTEPAPVAQQ